MHVPYFECTDFKVLICFWKFLVQRPKFGHFEPKNINFLVLTKFCMYPISNTKLYLYPMSKVLISNLTFISYFDFINLIKHKIDRL